MFQKSTNYSTDRSSIRRHRPGGHSDDTGHYRHPHGGPGYCHGQPSTGCTRAEPCAGPHLHQVDRHPTRQPSLRSGCGDGLPHPRLLRHGAEHQHLLPHTTQGRPREHRDVQEGQVSRIGQGGRAGCGEEGLVLQHAADAGGRRGGGGRSRLGSRADRRRNGRDERTSRILLAWTATSVDRRACCVYAAAAARRLPSVLVSAHPRAATP
mmetsp:Transcript_14280/g.21494  ORF Transcript_14280/g.21494 Transcript_14280/m.21494 type:complete len:209 (+) Transcript_14280:126-752(+)